LSTLSYCYDVRAVEGISAVFTKTSDLYSQNLLNLKKSGLMHTALSGNLNCAYNAMNALEPAFASQCERIITTFRYNELGLIISMINILDTVYIYIYCTASIIAVCLLASLGCCDWYNFIMTWMVIVYKLVPLG
jgi:hypothetical protein